MDLLRSTNLSNFLFFSLRHLMRVYPETTQSNNQLDGPVSSTCRRIKGRQLTLYKRKTYVVPITNNVIQARRSDVSSRATDGKVNKKAESVQLHLKPTKCNSGSAIPRFHHIL
jgi:hypothetical protein